MIRVQVAGHNLLLGTMETLAMNKNDKDDYHKKKRPKTKMPIKVTDNIPEHMKLHIPSNLIWQFFGEDLKKRFIKYGENTHLETKENHKPDLTDD